ncbi:tetratricopeptide repeat-containing sensor histidine kinase [Pedobacter heparinus]|uniref:ATP-binding region ATPase domain protein n=1 Tax=Pedobacter heparinus (strain ATCC 13125 / DSM 2366 / CIP 104194 / JCM 7457 / NBRC 12017 / NCIMB 9290 / NRRL B-14731 / HIM 762-3) TaxID=485917 RepID=C6Y2E9_PEDHD|nr:sensor histidine kinase [Pedobacter heparinus]ACU05159.1 ATP-binding region ATPase domain protein [Pedobacter heparinus DSM 2366]
MRKLTLLFFSVITCFVCNAQVDKVDSLLKKIKVIQNDTNKVKLYYALADQYLNSNLKEAEKFCRKAEVLSRRLNYKQGILDYYSNYANVLYLNGKFDDRLELALEAVEYAKKNADSTEFARSMLNAGIAYSLIEDYQSAVNQIEKARDILIRNNQHKYNGNIYNLLQLLYNSMHQYRKGANNGLLAIDILAKSKDKTSLQEALSNLGLNYIELKLYDSAKYYLNKAVVLSNASGNKQIQTAAALNFALIALRSQQTDSIKPYVTKALKLSKANDWHEQEGLAQYGLAYYYLLKKNNAIAQLYADSALRLTQQYNIPNLKQKLYPLLSSLYYARQEPQQGYFYYNKSEMFNDSLLNTAITKHTIFTEKKFETSRKEAQIKLQQSQLRQKNNLIYFLFAGALALLSISLLSYRNYRNRRKLQQAKIDELETEKQLMATEAVLKGEEQERTRLAKDLHDGLGGMLSGIKFSLSNMKENMVMTPDNVNAFERSMDMLDSSIKEMRRVAHNMMPEILLKYGLDTALMEFCTEIDRNGVLRVNYQSVGVHEADIPQTISVTIYRIVQELLNNAIKHAHAKNILVQLHQSNQGKLLAITVEDDGNGFDTDLLKKSDGMGWLNIKNRVEFLKGRIDLQSAPGKGTSVMIEINS